MSPRPSLTIVIPTKDEKGNIEPAVRRMPDFGCPLELVFVDGNSTDGTMEECARVQAAHPEVTLTFFTQEGKGKKPAVWQGFERAGGDIVMILDGDITVPPEELVGAYELLAASADRFVNCTRFRFRMEKGAMQVPNYLANVGFALLVSLIIGKRLTDTLCGTKGLWKSKFLELRDTGFLGGIDLYGDHELIFGAWNLGCEILEHPVHYKARLYGEAKIANQKFRGGTAFVKICLKAMQARVTGASPRRKPHSTDGSDQSSPA